MTTQRSAFTVCLIALLFVAALPLRAEEEKIIYPRSSSAPAPAGTTAPASSTSSGNTGLLTVAVLAAVGGGWFLWRQRQFGFTRNKVPTKLALAETRPLGNRQFIVVATYEDQKFLLGVCPGRIELLTRLDAPAKNADSA